MHRPSRFPCSRTVPTIILMATLLAVVVAMLAPSQGGTAQQTSGDGSVDVGRVRFDVEANGFVGAARLAETYGPGVTTAWDQFTALFGSEPEHPFKIRFLISPDPAATASMAWVADAAWAAPDGLSGVIAIEPFLALSRIEADNILRNLLSRGFMRQASGGHLHPAFANGIGRYVELPIPAKQARLGSLVQGLDQAGTRPTISMVLGAEPLPLDPEIATAVQYSLVAFITERYGVESLQTLVQTFATQPDWEQALPSVLGQSIEELDAAWAAFLPRWFASGWRDNAVSAFDLSRAQSLFDRGAYEAASAEASRSQQLFNALGDQPMLSRVEGLLAQSAVGLQADGTMADVQASLEAHDYARATALLDEAERLYGQLPEPHRPADGIATYRSIATRGSEAVAQLTGANANAESWFGVRQTRADALRAGEEFAHIGDAVRLAEANDLVRDLDRRLERLVLGLAAVSLLTAAWLAVWVWFRAPARLVWGSRGQVVRTSRST